MSDILPLYSRPIQTINKNYQGLNIQEASPEFLETLLSNKKEIQHSLVKTPIEDRLNTLQELANIWLEKLKKGELTHIKKNLSTSSGYSEQLINFEFDLIPKIFSLKELKTNLEISLSCNIASLEKFQQIANNEYLIHRPLGPILLISSGNSMIPPLIPSALALVTGNLLILKPSLANYLGIMEIFKELKNINTDTASLMSDALLISYFTHDSVSLQYLLKEAPLGVINFWGSEPARSEIGIQVSKNSNHPNYIVNGPLTGLAILDQSKIDDSAKNLAINMILYDQQLCSSPTQACFLGSYDEACNFAGTLGDALSELDSKIPMVTNDSAYYLIQSARRILQSLGNKVISSQTIENPWTILINKGVSVLPYVTKIYPEYNIFNRRRFIEIFPIDSLEKAITIIDDTPKNPSFNGIDKIQSIGLSLNEENKRKIVNELEKTGVYRIIPLEDMYMRSAIEPYDGVSIASSFTYKLYYRSKPLEN